MTRGHAPKERAIVSRLRPGRHPEAYLRRSVLPGGGAGQLGALRQDRDRARPARPIRLRDGVRLQPDALRVLRDARGDAAHPRAPGRRPHGTRHENNESGRRRNRRSPPSPRLSPPTRSRRHARPIARPERKRGASCAAQEHGGNENGASKLFALGLVAIAVRRRLRRPRVSPRHDSRLELHTSRATTAFDVDVGEQCVTNEDATKALWKDSLGSAAGAGDVDVDPEVDLHSGPAVAMVPGSRRRRSVVHLPSGRRSERRSRERRVAGVLSGRLTGRTSLSVNPRIGGEGIPRGRLDGAHRLFERRR